MRATFLPRLWITQIRRGGHPKILCRDHSRSAVYHILAITDRCSKLMLAIPTPKATATYIVNFFLITGSCNAASPFTFSRITARNLQADYSPGYAPYYVLSIPLRRFFTRDQNRQPERNNKTIYARLRHKVRKHQNDWDTIVQLLTYASNIWIQKSSNKILYSSVLSMHLSEPMLIYTDNVVPMYAYRKTSPQLLRTKRKPRIFALQDKADVYSNKSQQRYKYDYN